MTMSQVYETHKLIKSLLYPEALRVLNYLGLLYKGKKGLSALRPDETYDFFMWSYETHGVIIEIPDDDKLQVKVVTKKEGGPPEVGGFIIDSEFYR
ncbi:MAG: hypothetical protein WBX29_06430 [Nitrososphaeraceae archaeon]